MSTRDKMVKAKKLIQQKKYDEARKILKTVNHPTAKKWLSRIDEISPTKLAKTPKKKTSNKLKYIRIAIGAAFLLIIAFFATMAAIVWDDVQALYDENGFLIATVDYSVDTQVEEDFSIANIDYPVDTRVEEAIEWCVEYEREGTDRNFCTQYLYHFATSDELMDPDVPLLVARTYSEGFTGCYDHWTSIVSLRRGEEMMGCLERTEEMG